MGRQVRTRFWSVSGLFELGLCDVADRLHVMCVDGALAPRGADSHEEDR